MEAPPATVPAPPPPPIVAQRTRGKVCDVRNCTSSSLRNPELLFVAVPSHGYPERRFVWLTLMQAVKDKKRSYCCSRHFTVPDDFKDINEFRSDPPGYKRQLLVKRGVVPHLNMPLFNTAALPPLTDKWQMTLPSNVTAPQELTMVGRGHPQGAPKPSAGQPPQMFAGQDPNGANRKYARISRAIQTDAKPPCSVGLRKIQPSLQYCRLCFKRQDLEPIFTGDQTLIEPDLIDLIYGCTDIMISVEYDFPSSICTECYGSVHEFFKFRKLVKQNDQSLRSTTLGSHSLTSSRLPLQMATSIRTKTTDMIVPRPAPKVTTAPVRSAVSTPLVSLPSSLPVLQRNPAPVVQRNPPPVIKRNPLPVVQRNAPLVEENSLLEVGRVEDVHTYERRQRTIERNQPRAQRMQDSLYPVPYRQPRELDPLANAERTGSQLPSSPVEASSTPEGVQMGDRVVPVTLIRVQQETDDASPDVELQLEKRDESRSEQQTDEMEVKEEEPEEVSPTKQYLQPKPISQLSKSPEKSHQDTPRVLKAVSLIPTAAAKAIVKPRSSIGTPGMMSRVFSAGRRGFELPRILNVVSRGNTVTPKRAHSLPTIRMIPKVVRANKFSGRLTTVFSVPKKIIKPNEVDRPKEVELPKLPMTPKPQTVVQSTNVAGNSKDTESSRVAESSKAAEVSKMAERSRAVQSSNVSESSKVVERTKIAEPSKVVEIPKAVDTPKVVEVAERTKIVEIPKVVQIPKQTLPMEKPKFPENRKILMGVKLTQLPGLQPKIGKPVSIPKVPEAPKVLKEVKVPEKLASQSPQLKPKVIKHTETKQKENDVPESPKESASRKPPAEASPDSNFPVSPRSSRVRKVPLKFQDGVDFPMPKIITVKLEPDQSKEVSPNVVKKPKSKLSAGRRSNIPEEQPVEMEKKKSKETQVEPGKDKPKEQEPPTRRTKGRPSTRNSDVQSAKPSAVASEPEEEEESEPKLRGRKAKRKSIPDLVPLTKSPKLESKRNSLEAPSKANQQKQRANGSRKSAPAELPKKKVEEIRPPLVSSQDWKCPFCPNKVYDQKKGLVKHLRKRHGMDYALVRQRLAIYGGNWR